LFLRKRSLKKSSLSSLDDKQQQTTTTEWPGRDEARKSAYVGWGCVGAIFCPPSSTATTLIFIAEIDRPVLIPRGSAMKLHMDKTLRFWVDCEYEHRKFEAANRPKAELIAEILREYERSGDAMRYLDAKGRIAWKASPWMLSRLADAEREVEDDMEDRP
jgi:hypothetical protein